MKKTLLFLAVVLMGMSMMAQNTYTMIASESELSAGDKVLLVGYNGDGQAFVMSCFSLCLILIPMLSNWLCLL